MRQTDDTQVRRRLIQLLDSSPLTQGEIAREAGVHESSISNIKTGKYRLTLKMARKLTAVLPVSEHWLLYGENPHQGAESLAEAEPRYPVPPREVETRTSRERSPVICAEIQVAKCGLCRGELEPGAQVCRWCGSWLEWPEEGQQRATNNRVPTRMDADKGG